jgi:hypothetical protein
MHVGDWNGLGEFPEEFQWEALVDVLRGRVKGRHSYMHDLHIANVINNSAESLLRYAN